MENRVTSIRASVPPQCWIHCPGKENPADIPSRGMTSSELVRNHLWLEGPDWLRALHVHRPMSENGDIGAEVPEECLQEMKTKKATHTLVTAQDHGSNIGQLTLVETSAPSIDSYE